MKSHDAEDHRTLLIKLKHQNRNKDLSATHHSIFKKGKSLVARYVLLLLAVLVHRSQLGPVFQVPQVLQRWVPPVDEGVGAVVQLQQLHQRAHTRVVVLQHRWQAPRLALDAARTTHGREKLEVLDVSGPPGSTGSSILDGLLHTEDGRFEKVQIRTLLTLLAE